MTRVQLLGIALQPCRVTLPSPGDGSASVNFVATEFGLNQQHLHLSETRAGLVMVDRVKEVGRASAREPSSVTVLHLTELGD